MEIPFARETSDQVAAGNAGDTHTALIKVVADAINTAIGNKTTSATFSTSGKQGPDVMNVISELRRKGHKVTTSGTTVTVSW